MKAVIFAGVGLLVVGDVASAATPQELCKGGELVNLRTSKLKTADSRGTFVKAVHDNQAWYRSHGVAQNDQVAGSVLVFDRATRSWSVSPDTVATLHVNPPGSAGPAHDDAAWNAFVSEYKAASDLQTETMICLERPIK